MLRAKSGPEQILGSLVGGTGVEKTGFGLLLRLLGRGQREFPHLADPRLGFCHRALGGNHRCFEFAGLEHDERLALLDDLALADQHVLHRAGDLTSDIDAIWGFHMAARDNCLHQVAARDRIRNHRRADEPTGKEPSCQAEGDQ